MSPPASGRRTKRRRIIDAPDFGFDAAPLPGRDRRKCARLASCRAGKREPMHPGSRTVTTNLRQPRAVRGPFLAHFEQDWRTGCLEHLRGPKMRSACSFYRNPSERHAARACVRILKPSRKQVTAHDIRRLETPPPASKSGFRAVR
ncbi:hypothetical protein Bpla01_63720 [Burkholderia plantarii]|nr:hypothetical protein Bpla01_63720 [Burkholderia plantarii]